MLCALVCQPALAQVGHPPSNSPFRDIRKGHTLTATGGYFGGSGGEFNIGPHRGEVFGGRYDIRTGSTIQVGLAVAHGNLDRFIVDPFVRLANRRSGPVRQPVTFAEIALQFNLSGGKSWHRLAPFVGAAVGLAFAKATPADTSQYEFGRKFYLAPSAGFRFFITRSASPAGRGAGSLLEAELPDHISGGAGRGAGNSREPQRRDRGEQVDGVDRQSVAAGGPGIFVLTLTMADFPDPGGDVSRTPPLLPPGMERLA